MTITAAIQLYVKALVAKAYARRTVDTYEPHLRMFAEWAGEHRVTQCHDIDLELLRHYQADLAARISRFKRLLALRSQAKMLGAVKGLCAFLAQRGILLMDPARSLELPRTRRSGLPYGLPTVREIVRILKVPDTTTPVGLRDRAVLEVLYSTGIRNAELRGLRVWDVDLVDGTLAVHQGKGQKSRVLPLGREARRWVSEYLTHVRPHCAPSRSTPTLFLTTGGKPLDFKNLNTMVRRCTRQAGVNKRVTVHTFRHACATHMLQNGADIRYIQRLLGHRSLLSTTVYTHLEIRDLKRVHRKCHPRARRRRRPVEDPSAGD